MLAEEWYEFLAIVYTPSFLTMRSVKLYIMEGTQGTVIAHTEPPGIPAPVLSMGLDCTPFH